MKYIKVTIKSCTECPWKRLSVPADDMAFVCGNPLRRDFVLEDLGVIQEWCPLDDVEATP